MATLSGFVEWLRTLRRLTAQRQALEQREREIRALEAQSTADQRRIHSLEVQSSADQRRIHSLEVQSSADQRQIGALAAQLEALRAQLREQADHARRVGDGIRLEIESLRANLERAAEEAAELRRVDRELETRAAGIDARLDRIEPPFPPIRGLGSTDSAAWFHAAIEGTFRGPPEVIRERQRVYVPYLAQLPAAARSLTAVDLGCGRGEWLELLRDEGLNALGIDDNPVSVERCVARGLQAQRADALEYLRRQPDAACSVISAFHLVEHLAPELVMMLLFEAKRVLAPGGLLILETPNPDNLQVGSNSFYLDPTHRHPLPLALLRVLVQFAGLVVVDTLALQPDEELREQAAAERWPPTLTRLLAGPRDAGIVAANGTRDASDSSP
jgi:SAM-dependent methyltransferase